MRENKNYNWFDFVMASGTSLNGDVLKWMRPNEPWLQMSEGEAKFIIEHWNFFISAQYHMDLNSPALPLILTISLFLSIYLPLLRTFNCKSLLWHGCSKKSHSHRTKVLKILFLRCSVLIRNDFSTKRCMTGFIIYFFFVFCFVFK